MCTRAHSCILRVGGTGLQRGPMRYAAIFDMCAVLACHTGVPDHGAGHRRRAAGSCPAARHLQRGRGAPGVRAAAEGHRVSAQQVRLQWGGMQARAVSSLNGFAAVHQTPAWVGFGAQMHTMHVCVLCMTQALAAGTRSRQQLFVARMCINPSLSLFCRHSLMQERCAPRSQAGKSAAGVS